MSASQGTNLSKKEKGRLKKLLKKAAFDPKSNSPGITCHDEAHELRSILKKEQHPSGTPDGCTHIGPSIHHVHANHEELQDAKYWKQTESSDHRGLIQSLIFGSTQDVFNNDGITKKRKRTDAVSYEGAIPSWAKLHNSALQENLAVIEFDITSFFEDTPSPLSSIMPSNWIGKHDTNQESILTKLISEGGHDGKRALPLRCRLFQGDRPLKTTNILMYLEKMSKKSKPNQDEEECKEFSSDEDVYEDAFKRLSQLLLPLHIMETEGYPMHKEDDENNLVVNPLLIASAIEDEEGNIDCSGKAFAFPFNLEQSKAIVNSMKAKVSLTANQEIENQPMFVKTCLSRSRVDVSSRHKVFSIDCEMVRTTEKFELARVTLLEFSPTVDEPEKYIVVLDKLVKPQNRIVDYVTKYSGITPKMLDNVTTTLEEIQASLLSIICEEDIIIGQSLENDFKALHLAHYNVVDTAILFKSEEGRKHSLKRLSAVLLKRQIQNDASHGHCSEEDAAAALLLALRKARLGANFQMQGKNGRKNLFSLTSRLKRDPIDDQPGFLKYNNGPAVCIGPNEWIKEHVASQSTVNALECSNITSSAVKALTSYLRPSGRRASLMWSNIAIDTNDTSIVEVKKKINEIIVSACTFCFYLVYIPIPARESLTFKISSIRQTNITMAAPRSTVFLLMFQVGYSIAKQNVRLKAARKDTRSTLGWSTEDEDILSRSLDTARNCEAFWISSHDADGK